MHTDTLVRRQSLPVSAVPPRHKWVLLALSAVTNAVAVAAPSMAMTVLMPEIARDLSLTLVQVGLVWGLSGLPTMLIGIFGGAIGDRFGPQRILMGGCLLAGLLGAWRGAAGDLTALMAAVLLLGLVGPVVIMSNFKLAGTWFARRELGFANGVLSMGMALGFLVGSMISATVLSPWLGGWRPVFILYGVLAAALALPWALIRTTPAESASGTPSAPARSMLATLRSVAGLKNIWLLSLAVMGLSGGIQGLLGYLPLYLRGLNWPALQADSALGAFHLVSLLCVLPIALGSDRLGARKHLLLVMAALIATGTGTLAFLQGGLIWGAVILTGFVRDGFMAILNTAVFETRGVDQASSGTALGFSMMFIGLGALLAPPLGNSLAAVAPGAPFLFWAGLSLFGLGCLAFAE